MYGYNKNNFIRLIKKLLASFDLVAYTGDVHNEVVVSLIPYTPNKAAHRGVEHPLPFPDNRIDHLVTYRIIKLFDQKIKQ